MISKGKNKVLAKHGIFSRSKVQLLTLDRKLLFNGSLGGIFIRDNPSLDSILLHWKELHNPNYQSNNTLLIKHKNVFPSCLDNHKRKTIIDPLPKNENKGYFLIVRFYSLKRVEILLTDDEEIHCRFSHKKFKYNKLHIVKSLANLNINNLILGKDLEVKKTNTFKFDILKKHSFNVFLIIILCVRNEQISRLVNFLSCKVIDFQRINSANFLSVDLKEGHCKLKKIINLILRDEKI